MEESNLINNDNTYNTDMSTSQSTIGGNSITNNKFNKDDIQYTKHHTIKDLL